MRCDARPQFIRVGGHRAKFVERELTSVPADSARLVNGRPRRIDANGKRNEHKKRGKHDNSRGAGENIKTAFDHFLNFSTTSATAAMTSSTSSSESPGCSGSEITRWNSRYATGKSSGF